MICNLNLVSRELFSTFLRVDYLHKLFGIFLHCEICLFSSIYVLVRSFIYVSLTHEYLFSTLSYYLMLFYLFYCSNFFQHWQLKLFQLAPGILWHTPPLCFGSFIFCMGGHAFLFSGIIRCAKLILDISSPSPIISHFSKDLWLLLLENGIRNQDLGTRCADWY